MENDVIVEVTMWESGTSDAFSLERTQKQAFGCCAAIPPFTLKRLVGPQFP